MAEDRLEYRRTLMNVAGWKDFSVQHVAFGLHRVTGWLLLAWVGIHLGVPAVTAGPSVWNPFTQLGPAASQAVVVGLFAVLLFHGLNGVRLLAAELLGVGAGRTRAVFLGTMALVVLSLVVLGVTV